MLAESTISLEGISGAKEGLGGQALRAPRGSALGCGHNFVSNPFARLYRNHAAERREVGGEDAKTKSARSAASSV